MSISLLLFLIGTLGFVLNRKNIILMLISIEIMLLAITFLILVSSLSFDDILGQTYAIYIIAIAGAESAIGLGILVAFYRLRERSLPTPTYSLLPLKNNYIKKVSSKLSISPTLIRYYSTESGKFILHPLFVSGFADASTKSIVIFGTNLTSTVGIKFTRKQLAMVQLAPYQNSVIIGLLLSDGWLIFASKTSKNARLGFKQSLDHSEYVLFVFNILSHYCSSNPHVTTGIRAGNRFYGLEFCTRSMPCLTELYYLFYPHGVKIVPHNIF